MASDSSNSQLAAALIESCLRASVREWVVGAGARNLPLLRALLGEVDCGRVWNFYEERSAAFFALGRARITGDPIAVVTTSGTAAAELLPATIEAYYAGVPLLLVTADRPKSFRGSGAPQSIEQADLLAPYALVQRDIASPDDLTGWYSDWSRCGPVHLNVCLEEPDSTDEPRGLMPAVGNSSATEPEFEQATAGEVETLRAFCARSGEGSLLVLLGELTLREQHLVEPRLAALGATVWAEATSGLRESQQLRPLMPADGERGLAALEFAQVLRIGGVPSLRLWRDLEKRSEVDVLSLTRTGFSGLARPSQVICRLGALQGEGLEALDACVVDHGRDASSKESRLENLLQRFPDSEPALIRRLSEHISSEAAVFLGNSLPIREWNLAASFEKAHPHCFASRGANGIDGQVSTFLGMAAGSDFDEAWAVLGDLTALYDLSAPWVVPQLSPGPRRRIAVINNGGGRIFDRLPAVAQGSAREAQVIRNEHTHDFRHWAAMWNLDYARWQADDEWLEPAGETAIVEICPSLQQTRDFWDAWETPGDES